MDILILIIVAIIFFFAGWQSREAYAMHIVKRILEDAEEEQEKEQSSADRLRLERHGEVLYAFTAEDEFIAQGVDLATLDEAIQKRFPGRKFLIKQSNLNEVGLADERL
jgi:hypothetical protein